MLHVTSVYLKDVFQHMKFECLRQALCVRTASKLCYLVDVSIIIVKHIMNSCFGDFFMDQYV